MKLYREIMIVNLKDMKEILNALNITEDQAFEIACLYESGNGLDAIRLLRSYTNRGDSITTTQFATKKIYEAFIKKP